MAKRNMEQIADRAKPHIPIAYDVLVGELKRVQAETRKGGNEEFEALCMLFNFGFAMGCRATRAGKVTKRI